jgi:hypothetical protein
MKIIDYIEQLITDSSLEVLEIGSWHGMLSDRLYSNGIKITAAESLTHAPIWQTPKLYPLQLLEYNDALKLKHWDIVIAKNVIHHLHSPYHFWDMIMNSCDSAIISSCITPLNIIHVLNKNPLFDCGLHKRVIILPPKDHVSYLEENGWVINEYRTDLIDTQNRASWLINAKKK